MEDIIYIKGQKYKKVTEGCSECGAIGLHGCTGKKYPGSDDNTNIMIEEICESIFDDPYDYL